MPWETRTSPAGGAVAALMPADLLGWAAAALMVATFCCRDTLRMRPLAVATNLAFIGYGAWAALPPVLALHLLLLPINLWRWVEAPGMDKRPSTGAD